MRLSMLFGAMLVIGVAFAGAVQPALSAPPEPTGNLSFYRLWARTDLPVIEWRASRAWVWGAEAISPLIAESNAGETRYVQYFDKGGMQFNPEPAIGVGHPAFVMASPVAYELLTGRIASGETRPPAEISIAGDADDSSGPTYATFAGLRDAPPAADGALLTSTVDRQGNVASDERLAQYGVSAAYHVQLPELDHQIASPFWEFIESQGLVYQAARYVEGPLFEDQWAMIGLPLTEAYWSRVKLGGKQVDMLVQVFERRVLTYTPAEPAGWQVQFANTGRHYVDWRYGGSISPSLAASAEELPGPEAPNLDSLNAALTDLIAGASGQNAVTVLDLQTGRSVSINGSRRQLAACTIKIPIAVALAQDIAAGKYTAADIEYLVFPAMGPSLTWPARELLRIIGDGDIGDGVRRSNEIMHMLGAEHSLMTHPPGYFGEEYGYFTSDGEVSNWLTTDDLVRMFGAIWRGDGLSPAERDYVLWSLTLATPFLDSAFRAPLPENAASFHKIGVLYEPLNTWNDAGFVVFERAGQEYAYAVAFLSSDNTGSYLDGYWLNRSINELVWQTFSAVP